MTNPVQRVLTALVGIPLCLALVWLGGYWFAILVAGAGLVAQHELYGLAQQAGVRPFRVAGAIMAFLVFARPFFPDWFYPAMLLAVVALAGALPFVKRDNPLIAFLATLGGVVYPAAFLSTLLDIRLGAWGSGGEREALLVTAGVFVLIWASDSFAYFVGRAVGRHALLPSVSPKKTWEGLVGGLAGALLVAAGFKLLVLPATSWLLWVLFAVIAGLVAPLGDLAESRMKRAVGAKDSSTILPGHGGLLDRVDALLVSAPLMYVVLILLYTN